MRPRATGASTLRTYSLQEIAIEKLAAISDRARNEPRDLYDLWYLLDATDIRLGELRPELETKLAFRNRTVAGIEEAVAVKEQRLKRLWESRLTQQMNDLASFDEVFRAVRRALRGANFPKNDSRHRG